MSWCWRKWINNETQWMNSAVNGCSFKLLLSYLSPSFVVLHLELHFILTTDSLTFFFRSEIFFLRPFGQDVIHVQMASRGKDREKQFQQFILSKWTTTIIHSSFCSVSSVYWHKQNAHATNQVGSSAQRWQRKRGKAHRRNIGSMLWTEKAMKKREIKSMMCLCRYKLLNPNVINRFSIFIWISLYCFVFSFTFWSIYIIRIIEAKGKLFARFNISIFRWADLTDCSNFNLIIWSKIASFIKRQKCQRKKKSNYISRLAVFLGDCQKLFRLSVRWQTEKEKQQKSRKIHIQKDQLILPFSYSVFSSSFVFLRFEYSVKWKWTSERVIENSLGS